MLVPDGGFLGPLVAQNFGARDIRNLLEEETHAIILEACQATSTQEAIRAAVMNVKRVHDGPEPAVMIIMMREAIRTWWEQRPARPGSWWDDVQMKRVNLATTISLALD